MFPAWLTESGVGWPGTQREQSGIKAAYSSERGGVEEEAKGEYPELMASLMVNPTPNVAQSQ